MNTPKPTAWSFVWKPVCVIISSRSSNLSTAPAKNAPRINSSPNNCATTTNPMSRRKAPRTLIWALESCSLARAELRRLECSASASASPVAITSTTKPAIKRRVDPALLESPEKKRESRMIAPKSAIDEPAMISWPSAVLLWPASASTGITMPSDVLDSMIATSSGASMRPVA